MLYRQMKYFVSVVDCNSFTEAAEQNYISQSAISQQIGALEQDLGVSLILRENRKFSLTSAGEYFYHQARGLLIDIDAMKRETIRLGQDKELSLKIGYSSYYSGEELHHAIAEFTAIYPEILISITNGTHEELRELIKFGDVHIILMEQRRAFSDAYFNFELLKCHCHVELSVRNFLSSEECVCVEELKRIPCILVSSKEQQNNERDFYQNTLGFSGNFIFAESLEEARLMVVGNRGFLPIEVVGTMPPVNTLIRRLRLCQGDNIVTRNYCAFWPKNRTSYYIEEFAAILKKLLDK